MNKFIARGGGNIAADEFVTDSKSVTFESEDIKLPVNITSAKVLNPEESAQKAAEEIFYIRNTRREILAGEFGEGFYGGGLGAALDQFRRDEEAYSKLFFGSVSTERGSKLFTVPLSGETKRYVVCRFSVQSGVMPSNDLSAEPVTLQITPLDPVEVNVPMGDEKSVFKNFMVATWVRVDLIFDGETIATQTMPLYEFGQKVSYPVSPVKK